MILRATSKHGPLELSIPVEKVSSPTETIHQLAPKKAIQGLEEGQSWLHEATDQDCVLLKERYPSKFGAMVQREAERLGERFQIAGKYTSFVTVQSDHVSGDEKDGDRVEEDAEYTFVSRPLMHQDDDPTLKYGSKTGSASSRRAFKGKTKGSTWSHQSVNQPPYLASMGPRSQFSNESRQRQFRYAQMASSVLHSDARYNSHPVAPNPASAYAQPMSAFGDGSRSMSTQFTPTQQPDDMAQGDIMSYI